MTETPVLVIGGGPAGIAAACTLAAAGLPVTLVEQGDRPGGAIHRRPADAATPPVPAPPGQEDRWRALEAGLAAAAERVTVRTRCLFLGVDADGLCLIEDRAVARVDALAPRALVLAVGAVERVRPVPGWHHAGVVTAGGLQVMMKRTGRVPDGRWVLAGSGPLLMAVASQMSALGRPPLALLEASVPLGPAAAALLAAPEYLAEGAWHAGNLLRRRVPVRAGWRLERIEAADGGLRLLARDRRGRRHTLDTDRVALHDGIRPNDFGLAEEGDACGFPVVRAGDCREVLGGRAAVADGRAAALRVLDRLGRPHPDGPAPGPVLARHRRAQAALARLYDGAASGTLSLPDDTVLCRCENRTVGDLRAALEGDRPSPREVRLTARFGMGACQGRFCADWVVAALRERGAAEAEAAAAAMTGRRWPLRPVPIRAFLDQNTTRAAERDEHARADERETDTERT